MNKVLVIAAHPDDEVLGAGGTIAKHTNTGDKVWVLILSEGASSRGYPHWANYVGTEELEKAAKKVGEILNVEEVFLEGLGDQLLDTYPLLKLTKLIEHYISSIQPNIVYTHYEYDINSDHALAFKSTMAACRPAPNSPVKAIYSFEIPSSTEWGTKPIRPNIYVDISDTIGTKMQALECYDSEMRDFPHPRSTEGVIIQSLCRGKEVGVEHAEAFQLVRWIK